MLQTLLKYILEKSKSDPKFHQRIVDVLDADNGDVGLVLSDRIINMPPAIAPPSYKMLLEEIQWANDDVHCNETSR